MRTQRGGRPNKVVKPSAPSNRGARIGGAPDARSQQHPALTSYDVVTAAALAQQQQQQQQQHQVQQHPDAVSQVDHQHFGDASLLGDTYANAASIATMAVAQQAGIEQVHDAEQDLDAEMEEGDPHKVDMSAYESAGGLGGQAHGAEHVNLETAANILANGAGQPDNDPHVTAHLVHQQQTSQTHAHAHQHQPSHQHHQNQQGGGIDLVRSTQHMAHESGYHRFQVESTLAKRLASTPGLRIAEQRKSDQTLNLNRRSNVEALFAHISGELAPQPCKNCSKHHGPWNGCVIVNGQMCGSCANCWFNASGARCSFHETRNQPNPSQPPAQSVSQQQAAQHTLMGTPAPDAATQYQMQQPLLQSSPSQNSAAHLVFNLGMPMSPMLQYTVSNAMAQVRNADKRTRQLILVEMAAKQLALHMLELEETSTADVQGQEEAEQNQQDEQQQQQQQQQHV